MEKLPSEVLNEILDQLEPMARSRDNPPSTSRKNPWARPRPYKPDHIDSKQHYARMRLVCKRFNELAAPYLFRSIELRFNRRSFARLESLTKSKWAKHVKKFVYLMPYLYEQGEQSFEDFRNDETLGLSNKIRQIMFEDREPFYYPSVWQEQQDLMRDSYDLSVLRKAMRSFSTLQQIQLLAIMVHKDIVLRNLASSFDTWEFIDCRWIPACRHAMETLFIAVNDANSPAKALCSPTMSPQSLLLLGPQVWQIGMKLWSQLTYLDLTFDERPDRSYLDTSGTILTGHKPEMAEMFKQFFRVARNLVTLYVRFTPATPARLPLEDVFHGFSWPKLQVLGVGSWMLRAEELVDLINRHQDTLKGVYFSEVYLLDGEMWKDVISTLKTQAKRIEWVGLQGIGYERQYVRTQAFIETYSDTSSEVEDDEYFDRLSMRSRGSNSSTSATNHDPTAHPAEEQEDGVVYGNVFMTSTTGNGGQASPPWASSQSETSDYGSNAEEGGIGDDGMEGLEDDGRSVTGAQIRHWERWIVGGCVHNGEPHTQLL